MIAVIFEVYLANDENRATYLDIAADLRPLLDTMPGFISIERFASFHDPNKVLSLSFWKDEKSVQQWRELDDHRAAQDVGRGGVFQDYRLRVASVIRDYGMHQRDEVPADSLRWHDRSER